MSKPTRILGIAGSLRKKSYNRAALRAAADLLPDGASLDIFDLDLIPPLNPEFEQIPPAPVVELKAHIREADAILFATPSTTTPFQACSRMQLTGLQDHAQIHLLKANPSPS